MRMTASTEGRLGVAIEHLATSDEDLEAIIKGLGYIPAVKIHAGLRNIQDRIREANKTLQDLR